MSVILLILKIIGIVLLALLGIILAVICVALFVPIRYRVNGMQMFYTEETKKKIEFES